MGMGRASCRPWKPHRPFQIANFFKHKKTPKKTIDISQTLWHNKPRRSEMDEPNRRERLGGFLDASEKSPKSS